MSCEDCAGFRDEAAWWREATEIKREQAKKLRALSARRGRELKEARAELKRLRAENEKAARFMAAFGAKP